MSTTKFFEIDVDHDKWRTPDEIRVFEEQFTGLKWAARDTIGAGASESTIKYIEANQAKYDQGMRQLTWNSRRQIIHEDRLRQFLPCHVERVIVTQTAPVELIEQRTAPVMNERVQVVVPGPALNSYDSVQVLEDCCTDVLKVQLDEGWRILAICVQPDQRRPDYVMGRTKQEHD